MPLNPTDFDSKTFILGIGAQKSGTTWLYDYLKNRPDVYMHPLKEVHYFDGLYESEKWPHVIKNRLAKEQKLASNLDSFRQANNAEKLNLYQNVKDRNQFYKHPDLYRQHFKNNVGQCKAFGEITAEYSTLSAQTFRRMFEIHSDVRFVLLVRDPVDRLWSQIKMLSKFERRGFDKKRTQSQRVAYALENEMIIERSRYDLTLKNLFTHVPESNCFVGFYENLFNDDSIQELCDFLSLPFLPGEYRKLVNESRGQQLTQREALKIYDQLRPTYDFFSERYGTLLPKKWLEHHR